MKNYIFLAGLLFGGVATAQNLTDALRYSVDNQKGTARFRAMSGAFGATGGDFSAININPAAAAVYSNSEVGFSFGDQLLKKEITYFSEKNKPQRDSDFTFNQFGVVFSIPTAQEKGWRKVNVAFNYEQMQNFNNQSMSFLGNPTQNLGDYFLRIANGIAQQELMLDEYENKKIVRTERLDNLYQRMDRAPNPWQFRNALLGYSVGLIQPLSGAREIDPTMSDDQANAILQEKQYRSNVALPTQAKYEVETLGTGQKYNFGFSSQFDDVYIGMNLNAHAVNYIKKQTLTEVYAGATDITEATFREDIQTTGQGFSLQLGAIAKVSKGLRLGVSYASPTWFVLSDEVEQYLSTKSATDGVFYAKPNVIVQTDAYRFRSPSSWMGSVAYVFGNWGLINIDYTYKGYGYTYFSTDYMKPENELITQQLRDTNALRIGGELRYKRASLRAGYRWEQSPYREKYQSAMGNLQGFSAGAGYAFGGLRLDISYDIAQRNASYAPYEAVLSEPAFFKGAERNLLFTVAIKLF